MSLYPRIKLFASSLIWPRDSAWVGILGGVLVAASSYTLWSTWISHSRPGLTSDDGLREESARSDGQQRCRLQEVYPPENDETDGDVDIVALHGLDAYSPKTWTCNPDTKNLETKTHETKTPDTVRTRFNQHEQHSLTCRASRPLRADRRSKFSMPVLPTGQQRLSGFYAVPDANVSDHGQHHRRTRSRCERGLVVDLEG